MMLRHYLLLFTIFIHASSFALGDCSEIKRSEEELEKAWKSKIVEEISRYGRYSNHTLKTISASGSKRLARLIQLERECKSFEFNVSVDENCSPQATLVSLQSCFREE